MADSGSRGEDRAYPKVIRIASHAACQEIVQAITSPAGRDMKVREAILMIEEDGWFLAATRGSHRQFIHPRKRGRVTIAGKPSDDLAPGTLNSILKQAGLKEKR
jgi:predicted RNA binding protein YcfA (HicA-like mRNA interferase family)